MIPFEHKYSDYARDYRNNISSIEKIAMAMSENLIKIQNQEEESFAESTTSNATGKSNERRKRAQRKSSGMPNNAAARANVHAAKKISQLE